MKIGLERRDKLSGARYAVSAHLHESGAAKELKKRYPDRGVILFVKHGEKDNAEPIVQGISSMLAANGFAVCDYHGITDELMQHAADGILLVWGDAHDMVRDADILVASGASMPLVWWQATPEDAFVLPPVGVGRADTVFSDPSFFTPAMWQDALPYAARLGVLFDKDLFSLVYSTYDPVTLATRGCRLTQDLLFEDAGNVRVRLAFGETMAQVVNRLTQGELTPAEALAIGMSYEIRLGTKLGVCNPRKVGDLDGALTYHGLPRGIDATGEELCRAFLEICGRKENLTLTLPIVIGKCRTADYPVETLARLIGEIGEG